MHVLITGATGTAGSATLEVALADTQITHVTALVRRTLGIVHPKLTEVIHHDFLNYTALGELLAKQDAIIWCLGISQFEVGEQQYRTITKDFTLAAAKAALAANPHVTFVFLSGEGADPSGKALTLFGTVKGETEHELGLLGLKRLYIARPAGIQPTGGRHVRVWQYRLVLPFYPLLQYIAPSFVISDIQLAEAMVSLIATTSATTVYDNTALRALSRNYATTHGR